MENVNRTKILFIVTQSEMGGAQRYIFEIARGLDKTKYEVLVAAGQGDGELFKKLENTRVRPVYLKQLKRAPWPWQIALAIREIHNLLKKERPDILFFCSTTAGLLGSIASFLYKIQNTKYKIQIIYRIGGWAFRDPRAFWKNWLILLAEKLTAPLKDKIIVNSEIDRKLALKYKIAPESKIVKIYNGINVNSLNFLSREKAREELQIVGDRIPDNIPDKRIPDKVVGCVANFYQTKGLEYLIKAAARSELQRRSDLQILIIGEGKQRPKLENLIKKYKLQERVILTGRIPGAYKYLKAFDVFVLPSLKEGFPWIILEAIAAEIPIVATKVGALPEILDEEFLVEPKNSQELAKKISWMLEHPAKAKLKQEFTSQKMVSETERNLLS